MIGFKEFLAEKAKTNTNGTYVAVKFSDISNQKLFELAKSLGFESEVHDFHATVAFSRVSFDYPIVQAISQTAKFKQYRKFGEYGEALVLELDCPFLEELHAKIMADNPQATYDFADYVPHVSLTYEAKDFEIPMYLPTFELELTEIYSEGLVL